MRPTAREQQSARGGLAEPRGEQRGAREGLDDDVLTACRLRIGFGPMTLPHQLARVVAAEQIYRALTIARGLPYHR